IVIEFHEAGILDAIGLRGGNRKDDPFAQLLVRQEAYLDVVAMGPARPNPDLRDRCKTRGRIDGHAAVHRYGARPERQRRNMSFADGTKAQNKSTAAVRRAGLIGVPDDARIE